MKKKKAKVFKIKKSVPSKLKQSLDDKDLRFEAMNDVMGFLMGQLKGNVKPAKRQQYVLVAMALHKLWEKI